MWVLGIEVRLSGSTFTSLSHLAGSTLFLMGLARTLHSPTPASQILGLQVCSTTTPAHNEMFDMTSQPLILRLLLPSLTTSPRTQHGSSL